MTTPLTIRPLKTKQHRAYRVLPGRLSGRFVALVVCLLATVGHKSEAQTSAPASLAVTTADFNHDGIPDLLIQPSANSAGVIKPVAAVALGTLPYGTLGSPRSISLPSQCVDIQGPALTSYPLVTGDFNGDGLADIFFTCTTASSFLSGVMLGYGDGTFAPPVEVGSSFGLGAAVADFNHDGKQDLVLVSVPDLSETGLEHPSLVFYAGKGDGTFAQPVTSPLGTTATFIPSGQFLTAFPTPADVDGDGYPDIVVHSAYNYTPGDPAGATVSLAIFGNNKDGTFGTLAGTSRVPNSTVALGAYPAVNVTSILSGNLYGNGKADLIAPVFVDTATGTTPGLIAVKNTSTSGSFSFATPVNTASPGLTGASVGNFSGSGLADLAISNGTNINILTNDGSGGFAAGYSSLTIATASPFFALADANGDTYSDIYTAATGDSGAILTQAYVVTGSATATAQPVSLTAGTKAISASWGGNVDFSGSTASGTQQVNLATPVLTLTSNLNPLSGPVVVFSGLVAPPLGTTVIPTGLVILDDGSTELARGPLDSTGHYSFSVSALSPGTHPITATYTGDADFAPLTSAVYSQVVSQSMTTLTWPTPDPIAFGTALSGTQLDAAATDANGMTIIGTYAYDPPAGTVLAPGVHTLNVTFTPEDAVTFASATKTVSLSVLAGTSTTALALTSGGSAVTSLAGGATLTLTATVTAGGAPVTAGTVNFCDASSAACSDLHLLGSAQLTSQGTAVLLFIPGLGAHSYTARFVGTKGLAGSVAATAALSVTGTYPTSTTLTGTGSVGNYSLTATTKGVGGATAPGGNVSFLDTSRGNASLASTPLSASTAGLAFVNSSPDANGARSFSVAIGDLNGDGKPDLAVSNQNNNTVTVMLGKGDGTFTSGQVLSVGDDTNGISSGDFNSDGKLDLAIANGADSSVSIYLGNGDGTFTSSGTSTVGQNPTSIQVSDFNHDGKLDLAVVNNGSATVTILLGNGDGTFTAVDATIQVGANSLFATTGDYNQDGNVDLAVADAESSSVTLLLGNGDGTFASGTSLQTGEQPIGLTSADFNGDGKTDLAIANSTGNSLTILLGNGDGTFSAAASPATGASPYSVAIADFNGDGKIDLAVPNLRDSNVTILLGNGDGTFTPSPTQPVTAASPSFIAIADFNGDGRPDLAITNQDQSGDSPVATILLSQLTQTATATAAGVSPIGAGTHQVVASYSGDTNFGASTSAAVSLAGQTSTPRIVWTPAASTISFGTPLGAQQLNATATGAGNVAVAGSFVYNPPAGTVLAVGVHSVTVVFTPSDIAYVPATASVVITVTKAQPVLSWATPASIPYGTPLTAAQLNSSATGIGGAALPGTFLYNPAAGTVLMPGTQKLSVTFTPTDTTDYNVATASVNLQVMPLTLTSFTPNTARAGDADKTITLTGSGFVANSVVLVNGTAVATTFVSSTTLTAVIPAADLVKAGILSIAVSVPTIATVTPAQIFVVIAASPAVTLTGPTMTPPGSQPAVTLTITNPYPVDLTASFNLEFASATTPSVDDPAIQFAEGGRRFTFTIAANSETVPAILLQAGTVAGTITVPLTLTANGLDVTPSNLKPVTIVIPKAIPVVSTTTIARGNGQLSVAIHGFSNTREVAMATFHFTAAPGATITTPDITAPVAPLFTTWFNSTTSDLYGSTFTYTQLFDVSDDPANIGSVTVTLTNSVGASLPASSQ